MKILRALAVVVVVGCSGGAGGASSPASAPDAASGGAVEDASVDAAVNASVDASVDALVDAAPQPTAVDACAPLADAGAACSGSDPAIILFPNPSDALAASCRAYAAAEASGGVSSDAATRPTITVPANGGVVSTAHWITFEWSVGPATSSNDTYVVVFRQGCDEIARVVLQGTGWPVDTPTWTSMKAASGAITMTVAWMGGNVPSVSAPVSFTLGP